MWLWIGYALLVIGATVAGLIVGMRFKGSLKDAPEPATLPRVSTIVPARNEERNIERCARGLIQQDYPDLEMIFVDDASEDQTPQILAEIASGLPDMKVIQTAGKPEGWNGKQWACYSGAEAATGGWLCFMDADTYAEPDLIRRTLGFALDQGIDFLTLQPWYEMVGLWERIVMPAALMPMLLLFPPSRINRPDSDIVIANGQFILIRQDVYEAVDGHRGVRSRMMDDFSLAENVHAAGYRVYIAEGSEVMRVRMYRNLKEIWLGALKASVQLTGGWLLTTLALIGQVGVNVLPPFLFVWAAMTGALTPMIAMGSAVLAQLFAAGIARVVAFRAPPWSAISYPLGGIIVTMMVIDGMLRVTFGREIKWKDRPVIGAPEPPVSKEKLAENTRQIRKRLQREGDNS